MHPADILNEWLEEEKRKGATNARHAVLSTTGIDGNPHARVVAIREIDSDGLLFFTQTATRKVTELKNLPTLSLTFWFEQHAREVIIEGHATFLSDDENKTYWDAYPKWAQARFCSYAPTSGQPIESKAFLEKKHHEVQARYQETIIPLSPHYCGIRIKPSRFVFYRYRLDELSDVEEYIIDDKRITKNLLSP